MRRTAQVNFCSREGWSSWQYIVPWHCLNTIKPWQIVTHLASRSVPPSANSTSRWVPSSCSTWTKYTGPGAQNVFQTLSTFHPQRLLPWRKTKFFGGKFAAYFFHVLVREKNEKDRTRLKNTHCECIAVGRNGVVSNLWGFNSHRQLPL